MMTMDFLDEARDELSRAAKFYKEIDQDLAFRFEFEIQGILDEILSSPDLWRLRQGEYRRVNLSDFPYFVAYVIEANEIMITAVGHAHRHPDYWKKRLSEV